MEVKKTNQTARKGYSLIIYADSGKGKTYCLGTLPEKETFIIDIEGGLATIQDKSIDYITLIEGIEGFKTFKQIYEDLRTGKMSYKYVCIDSISELERYLQFALLHDRGKAFLQLKEYGDAAQKMREYLRLYRDLTNFGINIIFTALEMPLEIQNNEDGIVTKAFPSLSKKLSPEVCGYVDMVARLEVNPKTEERRLRFVGNDYVIAKTRLSWIGPYEPANLKKLFTKIKAGKRKQ